MIAELRNAYNAAFSQSNYEAFLNTIYRLYNHTPNFRISETPVFIPDDFKEKLVKACDDIVEVITRSDFKHLTEGSMKAEYRLPNEDAHSTFLVVDFGICEGEDGELVPKLIELQGFPSLYFFQLDLAEAYEKNFNVPKGMTPLFNGLSTEGYIKLLKEVIVGDSKPENVVLLEVEPEKQNTQIDFLATANYLGIKVLCLTKVIKKDRQLFYKNDNGDLIRIEKIYNRVIFDELERRSDLKFGFNFTDDLDVEWIGHPNWFFRISKYTLPYLNSDFVPKTYFLNELKTYPKDLENYVLKPLFSFSGQGVKIDVTKADLDAVEDKSNYILQEKVKYVAALDTLSEPAKIEIRMLLVWKKEWDKPMLVNNLIRLSKGIMIGVRYNKDKDWVGASVGFFNP
jgi:glutathionylspermidine synthase